MDEQREPDQSAERPRHGDKTPYRSPRFVVYGDLSRITAANKGVTKADGGGPSSHN